MSDAISRGRFYTEFADWWPLLSTPEDYAEEAAIYAEMLHDGADRPVRTILELGCGGGHFASHLKADFELLLTDIAAPMLAVSERLNPECEHLLADMRDLHLDRRFDAVFVYDAASYLTTLDEVHALLATARHHLEPGGVVLAAPDFVAENFHTTTSCGGHDGDDGRGLRYLEWMWTPDARAGTYFAEYALMLRQGEQVRLEQDRHVCGLFARAQWIAAIEAAGLVPTVLSLEHSEMATTTAEVFLGRLDEI